MSSSSLINRNVQSATGRTSMRLEAELWDALVEICRREDIALADLVQRIERRPRTGGRTSAVRVFVVEYFRALAALPDPADVPGDVAEQARAAAN